MGREKEGYRDNLESILAFTGGKHLLNATAVGNYLGIDRHTAQRRFGVTRDGITAEALARKLC